MRYAAWQSVALRNRDSGRQGRAPSSSSSAHLVLCLQVQREPADSYRTFAAKSFHPMKVGGWLWVGGWVGRWVHGWVDGRVDTWLGGCRKGASRGAIAGAPSTALAAGQARAHLGGACSCSAGSSLQGRPVAASPSQGSPLPRFSHACGMQHPGACRVRYLFPPVPRNAELLTFPLCVLYWQENAAIPKLAVPATAAPQLTTTSAGAGGASSRRRVGRVAREQLCSHTPRIAKARCFDLLLSPPRATPRAPAQACCGRATAGRAGRRAAASSTPPPG